MAPGLSGFWFPVPGDLFSPRWSVAWCVSPHLVGPPPVLCYDRYTVRAAEALLSSRLLSRGLGGWGSAANWHVSRCRTDRARAGAPGTGNAARALAGAHSMHYDGWSSFKRLTACAPPLVAKSGRPMRLALTPEVSSATAASSWSSAADHHRKLRTVPHTLPPCPPSFGGLALTPVVPGASAGASPHARSINACCRVTQSSQSLAPGSRASRNAGSLGLHAWAGVFAGGLAGCATGCRC